MTQVKCGMGAGAANFIRVGPATKSNNLTSGANRGLLIVGNDNGRFRCYRGWAMEPSQEPRNSQEPQRCQAGDIIVYPSADQQGCATSPFEFAQI